MRQRVCGRVGEPAAACLRESLPPRESASANVSCGRIRVEKRDLIKLDPPAGDTYGTVQADAAVSEPNSGRDRTLLRRRFLFSSATPGLTSTVGSGQHLRRSPPCDQSLSTASTRSSSVSSSTDSP